MTKMKLSSLALWVVIGGGACDDGGDLQTKAPAATATQAAAVAPADPPRIKGEGVAMAERLSDAQRFEKLLVGDPIAREIPMLAGTPRAEQLQTLRWLRNVPEDKLVELVDETRRRRDIVRGERAAVARQRVASLIARLESAGVRAPDVDRAMKVVSTVP